eukprot:GHVS01060075.1.p1 GENE.GHVS01060075.1~~GHVS01060075.1.p1  ORF type:complete len:254 (+),score=56.19 GHVS01060075.1:127-888(+)
MDFRWSLFAACLCLVLFQAETATTVVDTVKVPAHEARYLQEQKDPIKTPEGVDVRKFIANKLDNISPQEVMDSIKDLDIDSVKNLMHSFAPAAQEAFNSLSPGDLMAAVKSVEQQDVSDTIQLMRHYFAGDTQKKVTEGSSANDVASSSEDFESSFAQLMGTVLEQAQQVLSTGPGELDPNVVLSALQGLEPSDVLKEITDAVNGGGWQLLGVGDKKELEAAVKTMTPEMIKDVMDEVVADAVGRKAAAIAFT